MTISGCSLMSSLILIIDLRCQPILSPWADERVAAQRGVFTCHGKEILSLNKLLTSRMVRSVQLSREAAIHGVRFLSEVGALDKFAMFRDKDSLGRKTRDEFLSLPVSD
jgi:hypothetical protein